MLSEARTSCWSAWTCWGVAQTLPQDSFPGNLMQVAPSLRASRPLVLLSLHCSLPAYPLLPEAERKGPLCPESQLQPRPCPRATTGGRVLAVAALSQLSPTPQLLRGALISWRDPRGCEGPRKFIGKHAFWPGILGGTWKTPELPSLSPNPTSDSAPGTSTKGRAGLRNRWAISGPACTFPPPGLQPKPAPTPWTLGGHFPEVLALILKGTLGKWPFHSRTFS